MVILYFLVPGLMILAVASYFLLMVFYPEWVGITGKSAKDHLRDHSEGAEAPKDVEGL